MKKKLLLCILAMTLVIGGCGASETAKTEADAEKSTVAKTESSEKDSDDSSKQSKKEEPLDLTGTWTSENEDGSWMEAAITNEVIEINWVSDNGDTKSIYWIGTYIAPEENLSEYTWISERDKEQTDSALLASTDDTKEFSYKEGELTYEASAFGTTTTMRLTKVE